MMPDTNESLRGQTCQVRKREDANSTSIDKRVTPNAGGGQAKQTGTQKHRGATYSPAPPRGHIPTQEWIGLAANPKCQETAQQSAATAEKKLTGQCSAKGPQRDSVMMISNDTHPQGESNQLPITFPAGKEGQAQTSQLPGAPTKPMPIEHPAQVGRNQGGANPKGAPTVFAEKGKAGEKTRERRNWQLIVTTNIL